MCHKQTSWIVSVNKQVPEWSNDGERALVRALKDTRKKRVESHESKGSEPFDLRYWYKAMQEPEAWRHHQSKLFQAITGCAKTCEHTVNVTSQSSWNVIQ
jgi:hypothetical protein